MRALFLSASVPDPERDPIYNQTADRIAIRDAITALVTTSISSFSITWGGHPAITPLIYQVVLQSRSITDFEMRIFQSDFFRGKMPRENSLFRISKIKSVIGDRDESLKAMREKMLRSKRFFAGVFIGGMDGVVAEYQMFRKLHPESLALPVASTGGAAKLLYDDYKHNANFPGELETEMAYASLFRSLLS